MFQKTSGKLPKSFWIFEALTAVFIAIRFTIGVNSTIVLKTNKTCANDVSTIQWSEIRTIYAYNDDVCLVIVQDQNEWSIVRLKPPSSHNTKPVYNLDLSSFDRFGREYLHSPDRLHNLKPLFQKILTTRELRHLVQFKSKLFMAIWKENKLEEQYQMFHYNEETHGSIKTYRTYLEGSVRLPLFGHQYHPLFHHHHHHHHQSELNSINSDQFTFSMFGMDDLSYYPNVTLESTPNSIRFLTGPKFYFGFDRNLSVVYFYSDKFKLSKKSLPYYLSASELLLKSGSRWHCFQYFNYIYLLNGDSVFYFENLDLVELEQITGGLITIPLAVMDNNTLFRCATVESLNESFVPVFPKPLDSMVPIPSLQLQQKYFWHFALAIGGVLMVLVGLLLTAKLSPYDLDRLTYNQLKQKSTQTSESVTRNLNPKPGLFSESYSHPHPHHLHPHLNHHSKNVSSEFSGTTTSSIIETGKLKSDLNSSLIVPASVDRLQPVFSTKERNLMEGGGTRTSSSSSSSKSMVYTPSASSIDSFQHNPPQSSSPNSLDHDNRTSKDRCNPKQ